MPNGLEIVQKAIEDFVKVQKNMILVLHFPINYTILLARIAFYCVVFGQRCHRIASLKRLV